MIRKITQNDFIEWLSKKGSEKFIEGMFYDPRSIMLHQFIFHKSNKLVNQTALYFSSFHKISTTKKDADLIFWNTGWQSDGCLKNTKDEKVAIVEFKGMQNNCLKNNDIAKLFQYLYYANKKDIKLLWICRGSMARDILWVYSKLNVDMEYFFRICSTWECGRNKENIAPYIAGPCLECTEKFSNEKNWIQNKKGREQACLIGENGENYTLTYYGTEVTAGAYDSILFKSKTLKYSNELKKSFEKNLIIVCFDDEKNFQFGEIEIIGLKNLYSSCEGPFAEFMNEFLLNKIYLEKRENLRRCRCELDVLSI